jgi:hypothetical protein
METLPMLDELEEVYGLLCDLICAAEEGGNDASVEKFTRAADIVERVLRYSRKG